MVERTPILDAITHLGLLLAVLLTCVPVYLALVTASHPIEAVTHLPLPMLPSDQLWTNVKAALAKDQLGLQIWNSFVQATGITIGKILISILSAFAIVFFDFPGRMLAFWLILVSLMLPVEVRIVPTYEVAANALYPFVWLASLLGFELQIKLSLLNSYAGLILPLIASATATFLFRQFFMTIPKELAEAARIDGATPLQFLRFVLIPLSLTNIAAIAVIMFIYGWNQFLWPLLVTTKPEYMTVIVGVTKLLPGGDAVPEWNIAMAGALIAMAPPVLIVVLLQRLFIKGLVEVDK